MLFGLSPDAFLKRDLFLPDRVFFGVAENQQLFGFGGEFIELLYVLLSILFWFRWFWCHGVRDDPSSALPCLRVSGGGISGFFRQSGFTPLQRNSESPILHSMKLTIP